MALEHCPIVAAVKSLRDTTIEGKCINLDPYTDIRDLDVVRLRSLPNTRYAMNLLDAPSLAMQAAWRAAYESRPNDVMWIIRTKAGAVCGTNRLYDISHSVAEKGSLIVDTALAGGAPAALEAEVIVLNAAFQTFGVDRVITHVRNENTPMRSINCRFGFTWEADVTVRGVTFGRYVLNRRDWHPQPFEQLIARFSSRCR